MCERDPGARAVTDLMVQEAARLGRTLSAGDLEDRGELPSALRDRLAEGGFFALTIPPAHGGLGMSLGAACRVVEELAVHDRSVATTVGLHAGLGTRGLTLHASGDVARRYLPRLARGELVGAFAATEPSAGSDLSAVRTRAVHEDGELVIDGEKAYVTNGGFAGTFTILARTPGLGGDRARSLLLVPADAPGVSVGREEDKLGLRASSTVPVRFDAVRVPIDHALGVPGEGDQLAGGLLEWGRTLMASGCVGTARAALDATLAHVRERRQFGRPIGTMGATRAHVAIMAESLWAMRALVEHVSCVECARGSIAAASTVAKVFCSEAAFDACDRAVQLHGAMGFLEPTGVARLLRDCRVTRIFEGANDVLLVHLGLALLTGQTAPVDDDRPCDRLYRRDMASAIEGTEAAVKIAVHEARRRLGARAVTRQRSLVRLARAYVCLCAARQSLARRSLGARDEVVARTAARRLSREARRHLAWLSIEEEEEAMDLEVTEAVYGAPTTTLPVWPCAEAVS